MQYVALLRGINVGGNSKVSMSLLKACFEKVGFSDVSTYINSGNVIFKSTKKDTHSLQKLCEQTVEKEFGFPISCCVITAEMLVNSLRDAPSWWGDDPAIKHNALFVIPPASAETIMREVGEAKPEYEQVAAVGPIIFWSAPLKTFSRTRYSKIVGTSAYQSITIRNANTTRKLCVLVQK